MLFASREDDAFGLERMRNLERELLDAKLPSVRKSSLSELEDLLLVAPTRVVRTPLFLIVEGKRMNSHEFLCTYL